MPSLKLGFCALLYIKTCIQFIYNVSLMNEEIMKPPRSDINRAPTVNNGRNNT